MARLRCIVFRLLLALFGLSAVFFPSVAQAGLDLLPVGLPQSGFEAEWNALLDTAYRSGKLDQSAAERLSKISSSPKGDGDGLPRFSHGGLYGLPSTSFRGSFLTQCESLVGKELVDRAWTAIMRPEDAVDYGKQLIAAAEQAAKGILKPSYDQKWSSWAGRTFSESTVSVKDQIAILRSAGNWYIYWGERGHPIRAWW